MSEREFTVVLPRLVWDRQFGCSSVLFEGPRRECTSTFGEGSIVTLLGGILHDKLGQDAGDSSSAIIFVDCGSKHLTNDAVFPKLVLLSQFLIIFHDWHLDRSNKWISNTTVWVVSLQAYNFTDHTYDLAASQIGFSICSCEASYNLVVGLIEGDDR